MKSSNYSNAKKRELVCKFILEADQSLVNKLKSSYGDRLYEEVYNEAEEEFKEIIIAQQLDLI